MQLCLCYCSFYSIVVYLFFYFLEMLHYFSEQENKSKIWPTVKRRVGIKAARECFWFLERSRSLFVTDNCAAFRHKHTNALLTYTDCEKCTESANPNVCIMTCYKRLILHSTGAPSALYSAVIPASCHCFSPLITNLKKQKKKYVNPLTAKNQAEP